MADAPDETIDRRPLKSRDTNWAQAIAHRLASAGASPNAISVVGMLAACGAGCAIAITGRLDGAAARALWLLGAALIQTRLLCNLFDGMVAIERKTASATGELYNEVPDRISDAAVFIGLGYAGGASVSLGYAAALVAVFVAYVRAMAKAAGAPNDFRGPMAKPQRMALVTALCVYLAVTPTAWRLQGGEVNLVLVIVVAGGLVTAARRLTAAARHFAKACQ